MPLQAAVRPIDTVPTTTPLPDNHTTPFRQGSMPDHPGMCVYHLWASCVPLLVHGVQSSPTFTLPPYSCTTSGTHVYQFWATCVPRSMTRQSSTPNHSGRPPPKLCTPSHEGTTHTRHNEWITPYRHERAPTALTTHGSHQRLNITRTVTASFFCGDTGNPTRTPMWETTPHVTHLVTVRTGYAIASPPRSSRYKTLQPSHQKRGRLL